MKSNKIFRNINRKTKTLGDAIEILKKFAFFCVPGNYCYLLNKVTVKNLITDSLSFILTNTLWKDLLFNVFYV